MLRVFEGTVVKDLRSLKAWAEEFEDTHGARSPLGALNFTLAIVSLIACEAFGFYSTGALQHRKAKGCADRVDPGTYIMAFIQRYFPRGYLKRLPKVLADHLRHDLVHGFGSTNLKTPFDLALYVAPTGSSEIKVAAHQNGRRVLAVNGVALADLTLRGFEKLRREAMGNPALRRNFVLARRVHGHVGRRVCNEFDAVYAAAERDGLVFRFKSRARGARAR